VGGYKVARNLALLKQVGITHVINCASDIMDNTFEKEGLV